MNFGDKRYKSESNSKTITYKKRGCPNGHPRGFSSPGQFYFTDVSEPSHIIFARSVFILPTSRNRHSSSFSEAEDVSSTYIIHEFCENASLIEQKSEFFYCTNRRDQRSLIFFISLHFSVSFLSLSSISLSTIVGVMNASSCWERCLRGMKST